MPGLEPGLADSKSTVITNYTTQPFIEIIFLDNRNWTSDPGNYSPLLCQLSYIEINIQGGIRTREANASDLESDPFDHSGTCIIKKNIIFIHDGIRTRNLQIRSLTRYPIALHGRLFNIKY